MRPWDVAGKWFRTDDGRTVDVEHATDADFQQFVNRMGIPIDDSGIAEWSFDDRWGVIRYALKHGFTLDFVEPKRTKNNSANNSFNNSPVELLASSEAALQADEKEVQQSEVNA